jgi:transposase
MPKTRPPYPPEFRQQMNDLMRAGRTPRELAQQFEPSYETIAAGSVRRTGMTTKEREELRRESRQLKLEQEILARAAAWFARETDSASPGSTNS